MATAEPLASQLNHALIEAAARGPLALERELAASEFPRVRPGHALFAWRGAAEGVELLRWIHAGVDRTPFRAVQGSDLWLLELPVEDRGRFEYKLGLHGNGHGAEHWILDPLNPHRAGDPFGENSVCRTFGYQVPDWTRPQGAPAGRIEEIGIRSPAFGEDRRERIYLPAAHDPARPYPVLVVHDGEDYVAYADLAVSLDNLIAACDVPPLVAVLVQTRDRMRDYTGGRAHARYIATELLPTLDQRLRITANPSERVLLGASLGAVASLSTVLRYRGVYGGLILKSGTFILDPRKLEARPHPVFRRTARFVEALRRTPELQEMRVFVSSGELEGLAEDNRALAAHLQSKGVDVLFRSTWDGHHWHNWRDQLRTALMWVLRGQIT